MIYYALIRVFGNKEDFMFNLVKQPFKALIVSLLALSSSCQNNSNKNNSDPKPLTTKSNFERVLQIEVDIKESSAAIQLPHPPENGALACDLNGIPLPECKNGVELKELAAGDYRLRIKVLDAKSQILAIGERQFRINAGNDFPPEPVTLDSQNNLALKLENDFHNGIALKNNESYTFNFKFLNTPVCPTPELTCRYGSVNQHLSFDCSDKMYNLIPGRMALGMQYLHVQAQCPSAKGPVFTTYWYGVDTAYSFLAIKALPVNQRITSIKLAKANDCPDEFLRFECKKPNTRSFSSCSTPLTDFARGTAVRASCNNEKGRVLIL
jgi:hypothetical protein